MYALRCISVTFAELRITCHFDLGQEGVYHCDVSSPNMMWYKTKDDILMGILNDHDSLSSLTSMQGPRASGQRARGHRAVRGVVILGLRKRRF
jgi:hypothetical protein